MHKFKFNTFFSCTLWWCFLELWGFLIRLGCVVTYKILALIRTRKKWTDVMAYKSTLLETENRTKRMKIVIAKSWFYFCFWMIFRKLWLWPLSLHLTHEIQSSFYIFKVVSLYFGPHFYQSRPVFTFTFPLIWVATRIVCKKTPTCRFFCLQVYKREHMRYFLRWLDMSSTFNFGL